MAAPADITRSATGKGFLGLAPGDDLLSDMLTQLNNLTASIRLVTAKLDADGGVTDTNYDALVTDTGVATAPKTILTKRGL